jgi:uncharacterized protein YcbK (DUF882 family)
MTDQELGTIAHFTKSEIEKVGGTLYGLSIELFQRLDKLRDMLATPMHLLSGGLNSGHHISNRDVHALGEAADFYVDPSIPFLTVWRAALDCGFHGIGVYWNEYAYSFHVDIRKQDNFSFWYGVRENGYGDWTYKNIALIDPRTLL